MPTQSLTPLTREYLQTIKSVIDEEKRKQKVQNTISIIYRQVESIASTSIRNKYCATISQDMPFIKQNIDEIMSELQRLFPDSRVSFSKVKHTREGYVEVSEAEERMLELMNQKNTEPAIVIDWS